MQTTKEIWNKLNLFHFAILIGIALAFFQGKIAAIIWGGFCLGIIWFAALVRVWDDYPNK